MPRRNDIAGGTPGDHSSDCQPLALRKYAYAVVAALTRLQRKRITLDLGAERWRLYFSAQQRAIAGPPVSVCGEWLGHRIVLWLPQALLQHTLQTCMPQLGTTAIPQALFAAVASNIVGAWLHALPQQATLRIDTVEDTRAMPDARNGSAGNVRLYLLARCDAAERAAVDHAIAIDVDPALIAVLPELCGHLPPALPDASPALPGVRLQLQCEIGRAILSPATLRTLGHGDILFFEAHTEPGSADDSAIVIHLSHRQRALMRARIQQPDLMVITSIDMNDSKPLFYDTADVPSSAPFDPAELPDGSDWPPATAPVDETAESAAAAERSPADRLGQLPLQVVFDIGNCEMSFAELQKLQPGTVIPLASRMPEVVRVSVNGRLVASGELVEVDGRIGVMLSSLADAS